MFFSSFTWQPSSNNYLFEKKSKKKSPFLAREQKIRWKNEVLYIPWKNVFLFFIGHEVLFYETNFFRVRARTLSANHATLLGTIFVI
jgi:hypothetical protein